MESFEELLKLYDGAEQLEGARKFLQALLETCRRTRQREDGGSLQVPGPGHGRASADAGTEADQGMSGPANVPPTTTIDTTAAPGDTISAHISQILASLPQPEKRGARISLGGT